MSDNERITSSGYAQVTNTHIRSFGWKNVTVMVKDRKSKQPKAILENINGTVKSGEMLALMGPSLVFLIPTFSSTYVLTMISVVLASRRF